MEESSRALLLTDVVDAPRLAEQHGAAREADLVIRHDRIVRGLLEAWRGTEIDKTDGFLLSFARAADAVGHALEYHDEVRRLAQDEQVDLLARAGLHVGSVVVRRNPPAEVARGAKPVEIDGVAKPVAARVMALAIGGQTLLTDAAREALGDELPTGAALEDRGHWRLKGVEAPVRLHEVGLRGRAPFAPPPDGAKAQRVVWRDGCWQGREAVHLSLPARRDDFVGRSAALHDLAVRLAGGARVVSVVGPAGRGKTRLSLQHAWTRWADHPGGAWYRDLSDVTDAASLAAELADELGATAPGDASVDAVGAALARCSDGLVILDGVDGAGASVADALASWLKEAPAVRFLVTARAPLGLPGEDVLALPPMEVRDAVALFARRARARKADFIVGDANRADVEEIVRCLGCEPAAVEAAAARVRVLAPTQILQRLRERSG